MSSPHHILVATDFEPPSVHAIEYATALAAAFGARLTIVYVLEPMPYPYPISGPVAIASLPLDGVRPGRAKQLDSLVEAARSRCHDVSGLLADGTPWREIIAAADRVGADLIVVGSHGRHGLPRTLLGSVAERVVRTAKVPVLTVKTLR